MLAQRVFEFPGAEEEKENQAAATEGKTNSGGRRRKTGNGGRVGSVAGREHARRVAAGSQPSRRRSKGGVAASGGTRVRKRAAGAGSAALECLPGDLLREMAQYLAPADTHKMGTLSRQMVINTPWRKLTVHYWPARARVLEQSGPHMPQELSRLKTLASFPNVGDELFQLRQAREHLVRKWCTSDAALREEEATGARSPPTRWGFLILCLESVDIALQRKEAACSADRCSARQIRMDERQRNMQGNIDRRRRDFEERSMMSSARRLVQRHEYSAEQRERKRSGSALAYPSQPHRSSSAGGPMLHHAHSASMDSCLRWGSSGNS